MKTKGITIWEKHAEKIVVAIAVVVAVGVTAMQFIGEPNAVQKAGKTIAPGEIDDVLREQARTLLAKFDDKATMSADAQMPDPVGALDSLLSALDGSVSPQPTLPPIHMALAPQVAGVGGWQTNAEFPVPQIKAPGRIVIAQTSDTLEDGVIDQFPELKELFDDADGPKDVLYATPFALFDLADLRHQFVGDDADDQDRVIIPPSWYNDRPENLVDVVIERQVLAGGEWSDPKTLSPIPGQYSFRKQLEGELDVSLRDQVLDQLGDPQRQVAVVRPVFYRTRNNDFEIPALDDEVEVDDNVARLREKLRKANDDFDALFEELESRGGTRKRREDRGGGARGGDDDKPGGGAGGGNPGGRRGGKDKRDAPGKGGGTGMGVGGGPVGLGGGDEGTGRINPRVEVQLNRKLDRLERMIDQLVADLQALGIDPFDDGEGPSDAFALLEKDSLVIWGHDLYVEPGKTYRYRLAVKVYNPFFGKKRSLLEIQQHLAESLTLSSATSPWSDPVRISPAIRVFITRAAPPSGRSGLGAMGSATAEVYRFYDGHHWVESFTVSPGEYIGGVRTMKLPNGGGSVDIDFRTSLFVLDIVEDIDSGNESRGSLPERPDAKVLLQDYETGEISPLRDPVTDSRHPDRSRLQRKLRAYGGA